MSPVKTAKDISELTGIWAVVGMIGYMIYADRSNGNGMKPEDLGKVAAAAAVEVQKAPSGEVVDLKFDQIGTNIAKNTAMLERIDQKIDPMTRQLDSAMRRLDAIEVWISKQDAKQ